MAIVKAKKSETYLYVQTVANLLKVSENTVYRNIREGRLRAVRVGGRALRIPQSAFDEFVKNREVDPNEELV